MWNQLAPALFTSIGLMDQFVLKLTTEFDSLGAFSKVRGKDPGNKLRIQANDKLDNLKTVEGKPMKHFLLCIRETCS